MNEVKLGVRSNLDSAHIVYIVTSSMTADLLLRGQLAFMRQYGFRVTLIVAPGDGIDRISAREGVEVITIPMERQPSPLKDVVAIFRLIQVLRKLRPDIVNYSTPKASLLGGIASFVTRVRQRVYVLRGLRVEGMTGLKRLIFLNAESVPAWCATNILCNSASLRREAMRLEVVSESKSKVLGSGSSNGVDCERFTASDLMVEEAAVLRRQLGIHDHDTVIGFLGRMVKDKGVAELLAAFEQLSERHANIHLVLVGPREVGDDLDADGWHKLSTQPCVHWLGPRAETPPVYAMFDLFVLPTYREGLPNVALEAAAMGKPVITTRVTGAKDALVDGQTGTLVKSHDANDLARAIEKYLISPELRREHGEAGRQWVNGRFRSELIWTQLAEEYDRMMARNSGHQHE